MSPISARLTTIRTELPQEAASSNATISPCIHHELQLFFVDPTPFGLLEYTHACMCARHGKVSALSVVIEIILVHPLGRLRRFTLESLVCGPFALLDARAVRFRRLF